MILRDRIDIFAFGLVLTALLLAQPIVAKAGDSQSDGLVELTLAFAQAEWDGDTIPKGQQCLEFDGQGDSPAIAVGNIPPTANSLVLAFSDESYSPCDKGGHGVISYRIAEGTKEVTVPSIPGQTFDLPESFSLIREHCGVHLSMQRGAYIGPCPGLGNHYYVTVSARRDTGDGAEPTVLGEARLEIGTYRWD